MHLLYNLIYILTLKIIKSYLDDECNEKYNCFNCSILFDCRWRNNQCINYTEEMNIALNNSNITINNTINETKLYKIFDTDNKTIIFNNLKYLKNSCYEAKIPFQIKEKSISDKFLEKYCGKQNIVITNEMLLNGHKIQLNNIDNKYGFSNIICQYIFISGTSRNDVDIYINRTLSKDFLFFYSTDYNKGISINYSSTISLNNLSLRSVTFLYYSNKSFDSLPFIIYLKDYKYPEKNYLDILFLLLLIFFVVGISIAIIYVRYKSNIFNNNKYQQINIQQKNKENNNEENQIKRNLSVINEKNNEENTFKKINIEQEGKSIKSDIF